MLGFSNRENQTWSAVQFQEIQPHQSAHANTSCSNRSDNIFSFEVYDRECDSFSPRNRGWRYILHHCAPITELESALVCECIP
jgi:hypothetical protein